MQISKALRKYLWLQSKCLSRRVCVHTWKQELKITEHCVLLQPCPSSLVCFIQPDTHTQLPGYKQECKLQGMSTKKTPYRTEHRDFYEWEKKLFSHTIHKFASMHSQDNPSLQREANTISCIVVILKLLSVSFGGNYILQSKTSKNNPKLRQIFFICWSSCLCAVNALIWMFFLLVKVIWGCHSTSKSHWDGVNPEWQARFSPLCQSTKAMTTFSLFFLFHRDKSQTNKQSHTILVVLYAPWQPTGRGFDGSWCSSTGSYVTKALKKMLLLNLLQFTWFCKWRIARPALRSQWEHNRKKFSVFSVDVLQRTTTRHLLNKMAVRGPSANPDKRRRFSSTKWVPNNATN